MKRLFDLVVAIIGLIVTAPLMALIAVAIKVDSPGRVFFSQKRLGKDGQVFRIHKFRKFPDDWGTKGSGVTVAGDVRMTRLGRFLERSKLDELPQLWNIIKGDMSFVGPRPESLNFADLFTGDLSRVHDYKPGIFGPNQVAYRNESEMYPPDRNPDEFYRSELFPAKARNDIAYFSRATLLSDIGWMVRGIWVSLAEAINWKRVLRQRGMHVAFDVCAVVAGWLGANLLRFEGLPAGGHLDVMLAGLWMLPLLVVGTLVIGGCYRQPVRHFSLSGTVRIFSAVTIAYTFFAILAMAIVYRNLSIMVLPLGGFSAFLLMLAGRLSYRERWRGLKRSRNGMANTYRVAIYGAGRRGGALAALIQHGFPESRVVGFIDDSDDEMRGREIQGLRVLGSERDLGTVQAVHGLDQLWTTFEPEARKEHRLRKWCERNHVRLVVLPRSRAFAGLAGEIDEPVAAVQASDPPERGKSASDGSSEVPVRG